MVFFSRLARKRVLLFRRNRQAFYSFIFLSLLAGISLCADLICNSRPLLIRFNGHYYLPFLQVIPENLLGGEFQTEADYKNEELIER
ncbi:MAG: ABC transporter permease, partial [Deltaproteobacteria bacterium]|nr:ABC transporter permease [Deltaproteobacteria bacterium]